MIDTTGASHQHNEIALSALSILRSATNTGVTSNPQVERNSRTGNEVLCMPRAGQPHNEYEDIDFIARSYPELYPYGVGYPGATRKVTVPLQKHLQFALMHCSRSYSKHSTFMFHVFNIIQRRKSCFQAKLQTRRKDYDRVCDILKDLSHRDIERAIAKDPFDYPTKIKLLLEKLYSLGTYIQGSQASTRTSSRDSSDDSTIRTTPLLHHPESGRYSLTAVPPIGWRTN